MITRIGDTLVAKVKFRIVRSHNVLITFSTVFHELLHVASDRRLLKTGSMFVDLTEAKMVKQR